MIEEITFELTDYCPWNCNYCSSKTTDNKEETEFLDIDIIKNIYLKGKQFKHIILSGGEPLSHPKFYDIYNLCKLHTKDVVVYSNLITHRIYNANVIDGVYLEANITLLPEVDKVHILRRVKQGKELNRPEVHLSRNYKEDCSCDHRVVIPNGSITLTPCNKDVEPLTKGKYENRIYVIGAHGVGKSTLLVDAKIKLKINYYENVIKNPYKENVYKRQLWRLMKYKSDEELLSTFENNILINRCCIDWLIYTNTFKDLKWITTQEYNYLINKYNEFFNEIPNNIIYLNPDKEWSENRIIERWKNHGKKWRENNFNYYNILRKNYDKFIDNISNSVNIVEVQEVERFNRLEYVKSFI